MIKFGIIGAGWRSEFYLRIASLVPEKFSVSGIYIRNESKRHEFAKKYRVTIFDNLEDLLNTDFDFIVSCVNRDSINETAQILADRGIAVLTETPVSAENLKGKIQVAEQFHFMPQNQAYKRIIDSGILGEVHQVELSCCHDYHSSSLIRFFLDIKDEVPQKTSVTLPHKVNQYNQRSGLTEPTETISEQKIIIFDFGDKTAIHNFIRNQYFSEIRASRILIRGTNGEISNNTCTYLKDGLPHSFEIKRNCLGAQENLDGFALFNITGNGEVLYKNPFGYARLSDEEIAIATCLVKMKDYCTNSVPFYSTEDALKDYLLTI